MFKYHLKTTYYALFAIISYHIVDFYCWVDQHIEESPYTTGRPVILSNTELLTILIWNTIVLK